jgi:hypothetical protein
VHDNSDVRFGEKVPEGSIVDGLQFYSVEEVADSMEIRVNPLENDNVLPSFDQAAYQVASEEASSARHQD